MGFYNTRLETQVTQLSSVHRSVTMNYTAQTLYYNILCAHAIFRIRKTQKWNCLPVSIHLKLDMVKLRSQYNTNFAPALIIFTVPGRTDMFMNNCSSSAKLQLCKLFRNIYKKTFLKSKSRSSCSQRSFNVSSSRDETCQSSAAET